MGQGMAARRRLEPDSAGQQTPVEFRKGDIHRQVTRRQPAWMCPSRRQGWPTAQAENRGIDGAEGAGGRVSRHRRIILSRVGDGEACHVQDHVGPACASRSAMIDAESTSFRLAENSGSGFRPPHGRRRSSHRPAPDHRPEEARGRRRWRQRGRLQPSIFTRDRSGMSRPGQ